MITINFTKHILPHALAIAAFLLVTVFFFNPVFFENKSLSQHDIQMGTGASKIVRDYRDKTGEEALWAPNMFSGMPAYMISTEWSNGPVIFFKKIISFGLPHPVNNIFISLVCYYIMLLAFGVRPYLAIGGAIAFSFSTNMIIGLGAGHNARIGAIAFAPLIMAGIHTAFSGRRILGFGVTALGIAMQLRENHIQITYYFVLIILVYGLVQLVDAITKKKVPDFFKTVAILLPAALIAAGTFLGQFWALNEYSNFTIRGPSELKTSTQTEKPQSGLSRSYTFEYSNDIGGELILLIPNYFGGNGSHNFVSDQSSNVYQALVQSGDQKVANQLAQYANAYRGNHTPAPYYAGAIICFLFVLGLFYADRKYIWWLAPLSVLSIVLSWGESFPSFNYFMFDHFPLYNKFRSVTFALVIILFAMPLLGTLGLENLLKKGWNKKVINKLLWPFGIVAGLCLILALFGGFGSYLRDVELQGQLPEWFTNALAEDRSDFMQSDAWRSFWFITIFFGLLLTRLKNWIGDPVFLLVAGILVTFDLGIVDKRYFDKTKYIRKGSSPITTPYPSDLEIQKDKSYYRVYNIDPQSPLNTWATEARTSYFHNSVGGYHGAKLRRYQDLFDSCVVKETIKFLGAAQAGNLNFKNYPALNMLNVKYIAYGPDKNNIIPNSEANGNAWFVREAMPVNSPTEELEKVCWADTKQTAVVNTSAFKLPEIQYDSNSTVKLTKNDPNHLVYESESQVQGLVVFSEIYYPKGWIATIDETPAEIIQADYVLRALVVPAGKHTIEFKFKPKAYYIGNKITMTMSWLLLLAVVGCFGWSLRKN